MAAPQKWYEGISRYQWLVLIIASLGWVFDVFEGQIFVAAMRDAVPEMLGLGADHPEVRRWNDWGFGLFALGGAIGGIGFGILSDRIGRARTLVVTILFYSVFTLMQAFVQSPVQLMVLRFFVALGTGGEWAVAAAMVAEVMPKRSRPAMGSIFHASSVFGTLIAAAVGALVIANPALGWRWGFAVGILPALLCVWIRLKLREPDKAVKARAEASKAPVGRLTDLFNSANLRNTVIGTSMACIGLVTFWGVHIYGKNALLRHAQSAVVAESALVAPVVDAGTEAKAAFDAQKKSLLAEPENKARVKRAEMTSMALNTIGGGLGLVLFGWISNKLGRRGAFILYHAVGFLAALVLFKFLLPSNPASWHLMLFLPVFGFFTLGMHAGYAVYFPELFPTRLRGTGAGFCFNMGRLAMAAAFFGLGAYGLGLSPEGKALWLAPLYLLGVVVVLFAKETRGEELPE